MFLNTWIKRYLVLLDYNKNEIFSLEFLGRYKLVSEPWFEGFGHIFGCV